MRVAVPEIPVPPLQGPKLGCFFVPWGLFSDGKERHKGQSWGRVRRTLEIPRSLPVLSQALPEGPSLASQTPSPPRQAQAVVDLQCELNKGQAEAGAGSLGSL